MLHLLQVGNVGQILGGTAACAWTVTRCLPDCRHTVAFLSPVSAETRSAFAHTEVAFWPRVTSMLIRNSQTDLVLLHNTRDVRCENRLPVPSLQYLHSRIRPALANRTVVCSKWLADQLQMSHKAVMHQAVPRPLRWPSPLPGPDEWTPLVIGRLCTPQSRKWPPSLVPFYRRLATQHPRVRWEFVGCPGRLRLSLQQACGGRATFHQASRDARAHLWNWDAMLYHHPDLTESFGRTVAEAMRTGCVPIVDNRGGFREQIADGCGFLCDDEGEFQNAVASLQNRQLLRIIAENARSFADRRFSLRSFRQRLLRQFAVL